MGFIAAALIVGGTAAAGSYMSGRSARKAQNSQNDANARMAQMANEMEMERYYQSRGAAMGASYNELIAKPSLPDGSFNPDYDPNLSMFSPDGSAKESAVLPLYLSELEGDMADNFESTYGALGDSYDGLSEFERMQSLRQSLAGTEQGMIDTVNQVYDGTELAEGQDYLKSILSSRLEGVDNVQRASQLGLLGKSDARFAGAQAMGDARITGAGLNREARLQGLDEIQQERLSASQAEAQAILNEGQRNAANADFTGRSGIVGASGNSQAATLSALMNAYTDAGVNAANNRVLNAQDAADVYIDNAQDYGAAYLDNSIDANSVFLDNATDADAIATQSARNRANALEQSTVANYALYEQNLKNRKDFGQSTGALNTISKNATAGLNNIYAAQDATSDSLRNAGMQIGQGKTPAVNIPNYTAPVKESVMGSLAQGLQSGVSTYLMANAMFPGGGSNPGAVAYKPGWDKASTQAAFNALPGS